MKCIFVNDEGFVDEKREMTQKELENANASIEDLGFETLGRWFPDDGNNHYPNYKRTNER